MNTRYNSKANLLRELSSTLKSQCALRGCPISIKMYFAVHSQSIRVLPGKKAQYWAPEATFPVFNSLYLQILREEAVNLGFTHVRGLVIDPKQYVLAIQEEFHHPEVY